MGQPDRPRLDAPVQLERIERVDHGMLEVLGILVDDRGEPEAFGAAQNAFIARTHYRPAVAAVLETTGLDLDSRHLAVREAAWSVAVQHGRASRILIDAVEATKREATLEDCCAFDRALVGRIYEERSAYVLRLAARAGSAAARTLRSIVRNRYPAEREAALAMLEQ